LYLIGTKESHIIIKYFIGLAKRNTYHED